VILLLYFVFSGRMISEMNFVKLSVEDEIALQIAEGCTEEVVLHLREGANSPASPYYMFFRDPKLSTIKPNIDYSLRMVEEHYPDANTTLEAQAGIIDLQPLKNDPVRQSLDRGGHVLIESKVKFGKGHGNTRIVKQFRVQDISVPPPLNGYDLISQQIRNTYVGFVKKKDGSFVIRKLSGSEINILNNVWRYNLIVKGKPKQLYGYPYSKERISYVFPTWQDMKDYLREDNVLIAYGDVYCPDSLTLRLADIPVYGVGRIFSHDSNMILDGIRFTAGSILGFGILSGGALTINHFSRQNPAVLSVFLPSGKLITRGSSGLRGFALVQDSDIRPDDPDCLDSDPSLKQSRTFVTISGQTETWKSSSGF